MSPSIQKLIGAIFHGKHECLREQLDQLDVADLASEPGQNLQVVHCFQENAENKILFGDLISLLHQYQFHSEAAQLLDRFQEKITHNELVASLQMHLHNKQFATFTKAYHQYGKQRGVFSQLATDILACMSKKEAEALFADNKENFVITKLKKQSQYKILLRHGWRAPSQNILLTEFASFPEELIIQFLKKSPALLFDIINFTLYGIYKENKAISHINIFHLAVINNDLKLAEFLFRYAKNLACDYRLHENKRPYWLLCQSTEMFKLILQNECFDKHDLIKRDFYLSIFTGEIGGIQPDVYAHLNRDRFRYARQLGWMEDDYLQMTQKIPKILEMILAEDDDITNEEITDFISHSDLTLLILNGALACNTPRLIALIASVYQEDLVTLLRYLAPHKDLKFFRRALRNVEKQPNADEILIRLISSLLSYKLDEALLLTIKHYHSKIFPIILFKKRLFQYKNPTILLASISRGLNVTESQILDSASFAWMIGDKVTCQRLLEYTSMKNNADWQAFAQNAVVLPQNFLWEETPTVVDSAYGLSTSQTLYRRYQLYQAQLICFYLLTGQFSFAAFGNMARLYTNLNWDFIGKMRQHAAIITRTLKAEYFGEPRATALCTPINDRYGVYLKRIHQHFRENPNHFTNASLRLTKGKIYLHAETSLPRGDKTIPLTTYTEVENQPKWLHTNNAQLDLLLRIINRLICNFLTSYHCRADQDGVDESGIQSYLDSLAEIHWLLAQTTPLIRGSSSIAESIVAGLLMVRGHSMTFTQQADCEALSSPNLSTFQQAYPTFFKATKTPVDNIRGFNRLRYALAIQTSYIRP